jgi:hypothetical protein
MDAKTNIPKPFFTWKKIIIIILTLLVTLGIFGFMKINQSKILVKELFKLNKELQEQNYYMAEFEFKMLGIAYYLDKGNYTKSLSLIDKLHKQLTTKENLIKIPYFTSKANELEFYLSLQNPRTGAFMDDEYPLGTYHGPTENVLLHIEALTKAIGQPLVLKHPLKYLDEINTPKKLVAFLNKVSTVGKIASKLPQTSFHNARDILSLARDNINYDENEVDLVIQNNHLYDFSPEWRQTLLKWFYDAQDPKTGLWGPKSKNGKLLKKDLMNTASIMKAFVDKKGNNIHTLFPLRYKNELFASALETLSESVPADEDLDELHEWNLKMPKTIRLLTRYLWKNASPENIEKAAVLIENYIRIKCEKYYIPKEGAFSYYPGGEHATLDGIGGFFIFQEIGALSSKKQTTLWGSQKKNITDKGSIEISEFGIKDFNLITHSQNTNSLRFYRTTPDYDNLTSDVLAIVYPKKTFVLDIMDLTQKIKNWIDTTPLTMGNWTSKESVHERLASIKFDKFATFEYNSQLKSINEDLKTNKELVVIGFDVLQIPRFQVVLKLKNGEGAQL